jgi:hypothetical protein
MPSRQNATMTTPLPVGLTGDIEIEINGIKHPCPHFEFDPNN